MNFLQKLFGSGNNEPQDNGIYLYVKLHRSGEVVEIRINPSYELSRTNENTLFTRKMIIGARSFEKAEGIFTFNRKNQLIDSELEGGEIVTEQAYLEYKNSLEGSP